MARLGYWSLAGGRFLIGLKWRPSTNECPAISRESAVRLGSGLTTSDGNSVPSSIRHKAAGYSVANRSPGGNGLDRPRLFVFLIPKG